MHHCKLTLSRKLKFLCTLPTRCKVKQDISAAVLPKKNHSGYPMESTTWLTFYSFLSKKNPSTWPTEIGQATRVLIYPVQKLENDSKIPFQLPSAACETKKYALLLSQAIRAQENIAKALKMDSQKPACIEFSLIAKSFIPTDDCPTQDQLGPQEATTRKQKRHCMNEMEFLFCQKAIISIAHVFYRQPHQVPLDCILA